MCLGMLKIKGKVNQNTLNCIFGMGFLKKKDQSGGLSVTNLITSMSEFIRNNQIYVISSRLGKLLFSGSKGKKVFQEGRTLFLF